MPHLLRSLITSALAGAPLLLSFAARAQPIEPAAAPAETAPTTAPPAPAAEPAPSPPAAEAAPSAAAESQPDAQPEPEAAAIPPAAATVPAEQPSGGAANGIVLSVRLPVGEVFVRSFQGPQSALDTTRDARLNGPRGVYDVPFVNSTYYVFNGFRLPQFTVGLGFGFHTFQWEVNTPCIDPDTGEEFPCQGIPQKTADGHVFQFSPAVHVPYFRTSDQETEAYVALAIPITWGPNISPQYDPVDTTGAGTFVEPDIEATAFGWGASLGLGGQHFLHRNFAIGVESGIYYQRLTISAEASVEGNELEAVPDQEGWFLGGYAALTATVVVGH
jgi:hypothetical protein